MKRWRAALAASLIAFLPWTVVLAQQLSGELPPASGQAFLGMPTANIKAYGAIGDGQTHPLSGFYASAAAAEAVCPSLTYLAGTTTTGTTNTSTSLTSVTRTAVPSYIITGQLVADTDGDIPAPAVITASIGGGETATIGGTLTAGDQLQLTLTSAAITGSPLTISYTTVTGDTTSSMATGLAKAVGLNANLITAGVSALVRGPTIFLYYPAALTTAPSYSEAVTGSATETITLAAAAGNILNVSAVTSGTLSVGSRIAGANVPADATITALGTGTTTTGTYTINGNANVASEAMTGAVTVTAVNYTTGVVTLSQAATGSHAGDTLTFGFGVNWANVENDWCAIQGAIDSARTTLGYGFAGIGFFPYLSVNFFNGTFLINEPLNFTCFGNSAASNINCAFHFSSSILTVNGNGATIYSNVWADYGSNTLDALGSRSIVINNLNFVEFNSAGACSGGLEAKRGVQIGKAVNNVDGNFVKLNNISVLACVIQAPYYNLATEAGTNENSQYSNSDASGLAYQGIWDGGNYFQATSDYTNIAIARYANQSFNDDREINNRFQPAVFAATAAGGGLFIYGGRHITFENTYVDGPTTLPGPCATLFNDSGGSDGSVTDQLDAGFYCEGPTNLQSTYFIQSRNPASSVTIKQFTARSQYYNSTAAIGSVFAHDANTTAVTLTSPTLRVANWRYSPQPTLFDVPADYTLPGIDFRLPSGTTGFNAAVGWTGIECVATACETGSPSFATSQTTTPTAVVSAALDQTAATAATFLAFATTTGMAANQQVSGTNIPAGDQVASIVSTAQATLTANGVSNSGQKVLTTTATTGVAVGQLCVDTTTPTAIGTGNTIASIQAGTSITMTNNLAANTANGDAIPCDPTITLTQATTSAPTGTMTFYANHTALSTSAAVVNLGDQSIYGNLAIGGSLIMAPNGSVLTGPGISMVGTSLSFFSNNGTKWLTVGPLGLPTANNGMSFGGGSNAPAAGAGEATGSATLGGVYSGKGSTNDVTITNSTPTTVISIPTGTTGTVLAGTLSAALAASTAVDTVCYAVSTGLFTYEPTGTTCTVSDETKKVGIHPIGWLHSLYTVLAATPISYYYIPEMGDPDYHLGFGAQTMAKVAPELVHYENDKPAAIKQLELLPVTWAAIKELAWGVVGLFLGVLLLLGAVADLYRRNRAMGRRLAALEGR